MLPLFFFIQQKIYLRTVYPAYFIKKLIFLFLLFLSSADNQIAAQNTWTQKAGFSSSRHGTVSFGIGNKGYFGTGNDSLWLSHDDFWEFDPQLNSWTQKVNVPGPTRYGAVGFSIDYLGYVGLGSTNGSNFLTILSTDGKEVLRTSLTASGTRQQRFALPEIPNGVYILQLRNAEGKITAAQPLMITQ